MRDRGGVDIAFTKGFEGSIFRKLDTVFPKP